MNLPIICYTAGQIKEGQVLLVDKPLDWTSFDVVKKIKYKLRSEFKFKKIKVGHAGTLDPKATGLLVVCTGNATKRISDIQNAPKEYEAEIKLGFETESYDTEKPEILKQDISHLTAHDVSETLKKFVGEIDQAPPVFSAIKIDGKRAYDLARAGKEVEMKTRKTTIYFIDNLEVEFPFVRFSIGCSKGTYIRSLAHDIGQELGVGAYLSALRRVSIGELKIQNATNAFLQDDFKFSPEL